MVIRERTPNHTPVDPSEKLARYIFRKRHFRADGSIRHEIFVPFKWVELSMTRHVGLRPSEIWGHGLRVGSEMEPPLTLQGRADIAAEVFLQQGLEVVPKPVPSNPNHCDAIGWPPGKDEQMEKALEIAKKATGLFVPDPIPEDPVEEEPQHMGCLTILFRVFLRKLGMLRKCNGPNGQ